MLSSPPQIVLSALPIKSPRTAHQSLRIAFFAMSLAALLSVLTGCGSHSTFTTPPIILKVSLSMPTVTVPPNGTPVYVQVTIVAPTETATFAILGLPAGVSATYKESESNPSGLLTLIASSATQQGTYMPQITVGSSGQTASTNFTLVIHADNP
jgi:hypothetical protein